MARGGSRRGAGRKATGRLRVQIPVRVNPKLRQQLELLAKRNGDISLTKQTQLLLEAALSWPQRLDVDDLKGWRGKHQRAFGHIVAHGASRVEAVMGLYSHVGGRKWTDDAWATHCVRILLDRILEEHAGRLGPLSSEETSRANALAQEIAWRCIRDLDEFEEPNEPIDPDDAALDGDAQRILAVAARDLGWKHKTKGDSK